MIRKLNYPERLVWRGARGRPLNFALAVRLHGTFSFEQLQAAYRRICRRHPTLGTCVQVTPSGEPWLTATPEVPLRETPRSTDDDWVDVVRRELIVPFDWQRSPPVRMVWVRGGDRSELVTIWNHGLGDGLSAAYVLRDWVRQLGEPTDDIQPLPLSPGIEDLLPAELLHGRGWRLKARVVVALVKLLQRFQRHHGVMRAVSDEDDLAIFPRLFSAAQTAQLVAGCRAERTTVQGALCAAFLSAYAACAPPELAEWRFGPLARAKAKKIWRRRAFCPVNARGLAEPPVGEVFGNFMVLVHVAADCSPGRTFWEIARAAKQELTRRSAPLRVLSGSRYLKALGDAGVGDGLLTTRAVENPRVNYDLSVSNLGNLQFPKQCGDLQLEAFWGPVTNAWRGEQILGANSLNGRLALTFTAHESVLDRAMAARIFEDALARLSQAVGW